MASRAVTLPSGVPGSQTGRGIRATCKVQHSARTASRHGPRLRHHSGSSVRCGTRSASMCIMQVTRAVTVVLLAGVLTTGCVSIDTDRAEVAVAKCSLPVKEELGLANGQRMDTSRVQVQDMGDGRYRVTGLASYAKEGQEDRTESAYTCYVEPDSTDKLRGFRVSALTVKHSDT